MNPGFLVLATIGIILVLTGTFATLKLKTEGVTELSFLGLKIKTPASGLVMIALGIVAIVPTARDIAAVPQLTVRDLVLEPGGTYNVRCPVTVPVAGRIDATGTGMLSYRFLSRTSPEGPIEKTNIRNLNFKDAETAHVEYEFVVPFPEGTTTYEITLEVVAPDDQVSAPVRYDITCNPRLPPGPDTLPPDVAPPGG